MTRQDPTAVVNPDAPAAVFAEVWDALTDVMGSAATATLLRRAIKQARGHAPELEGLIITRERFEYRYAVPTSWKTESSSGMGALRALTRALQPLLFELTGFLVLHRLDGMPQIKRCELFSSEDR